MPKEKGFPSFVVIGSMRAGTTSLYDMLAKVKGVSLARMKETDFFIAEKNFQHGEKWYQKQFDDLNGLCGDVSPNYTKRDVFKGVPERVFKANPSAKIIFIARDPVERALSQYKFSYLLGQDMPGPAEFMNSHEGQHILSTSRYAWQIEPWIEQFGRDSIMIIDFESLCQRPGQELQKISAFIGLETIQTDKHIEQQNSAEYLGAAPLWYLKLRGTKLGAAVRSATPRWITEIIKQCVATKNKRRTAPDISAEIIEEIKQYLKSDADEFRKIAGMDFENWVI